MRYRNGGPVTATVLLDEAVDRLTHAESTEAVQVIVRSAARRIARAQGATLVLRDGDFCFYADEDAISPLWKGQRFPMTECISGWAMLHRQSAVVPDIHRDSRVPVEAYRPTFVHSLLMVPVRRDDPTGAIGTYWTAWHRASDSEIAHVTALAAATGDALTRLRRGMAAA